jgi:hypothetical protein
LPASAGQKEIDMISKRLSRSLLTAALLAGVASAPALAQSADTTFDPAQLPTTHGVVAQYDLSPRGDVDGLILTDGTEVHLAPYLGSQLLADVKPGDSVTIHGLHARVIPLVQAMSVTADKTGTTIADAALLGAPPHRPRPHGRPPAPPLGQSTQAKSTVKMQLHGPRGEMNGVLLADGTIVHMPPPAAARLATLLAPGAAVTVQGNAVQSDAGQVILATMIGSATGTLQPVRMGPPMDMGPNPDAPPPPPMPDAAGQPPPPPAPDGTPPQTP